MAAKSAKAFAVALLLALVGGSAVASGAQEMAQSAYEPQIMPFEAGGIGLVDAIRIALENDPNIKLQSAAVQMSSGSRQEQAGAFDWTFLGDISYEWRQQELRDSVKERERQMREDLDRKIDAGRVLRVLTEDQIEALENARTELGNVFVPGDPFLTAQLRFIDQVILEAMADGQPVEDLLRLRNSLVNARIAELLDPTNTESLPAVLEGIAANEQFRRDIGDTPDDEILKNGAVNAGVRKRLTNGITINPFMTGTYAANRFKGKQISTDFGGKGIEDLYTVEVGFRVLLPLARGRGETAAAAGLRAAEREEQASRYLLEHEVSLTVLETIVSYWDLRTAQESAEIAARSYELQSQLVEITDALIEVGLQTQGESFRAQSSQARAASRVEDAQRDLHQARVNLATVLGVSATTDFATLPLARDGYPASDQMLDAGDIDALLAGAPNLRRDLLALGESEDAGRIVEAGARANRRPQLDLNLAGWYTGLAEKQIGNAMDRWVGPSYSAELSVDVPIGNNSAQGRHAQAQADLIRRSIDTTDVGRLVQLGILREAQSLSDAAESVARISEAVQYFEQAYEAEVEKLRNGDTSLVDTILTEDQLTNSRLDLAFAQSEYARILAQLRFEAGRLVQHDAEGNSVVRENVITVPGAQGGSR